MIRQSTELQESSAQSEAFYWGPLKGAGEEPVFLQLLFLAFGTAEPQNIQ
jgi:hypothetical protein